MAVIFCNPRGSSCYGSAHESNAAAFDGRAMNDLLQFVKEACNRYDFIDSERLGVTGGSYGGYMTNWITSHSKVFKAAVTQRSIANELIEYASADMAGSSQGFVNFEDFMVQEIEKSSVAYAEQIDIPFLILHALGDMRCPVEHAHQLFTAVKDTHPDLPVRMVLFPHGNHEMNNNGRMSHRMRHYTEMIRWFENYL
jgi:acylaminoacyl-peptidase